MTTKKKKSQGMKLFLMILPFLILCFLFSYFPLHGWIYALYDYKAPLKLSQCQFVGLKWFKTLFSNKTQVMQLIQVMKNICNEFTRYCNFISPGTVCRILKRDQMQMV